MSEETEVKRIYEKARAKDPMAVSRLVNIYSTTDMEWDEYFSHLKIIAEDDEE